MVSITAYCSFKSQIQAQCSNKCNNLGLYTKRLDSQLYTKQCNICFINHFYFFAFSTHFLTFSLLLTRGS